MENVKLGEWISIGENNLHAVVSNIMDKDDIIEVVFMSGTKAINDLVQLKDGKWDFVNQSRPSGGYADNYSRLNEYVGVLRRGRYPKYL